MDGDNPLGNGSDGGDPRVGGGGGDSFVSDSDPLGALGGGTRLMEDSYGGSDNPFAGAHDGDEVSDSACAHTQPIGCRNLDGLHLSALATGARLWSHAALIFNL